MSKISIPIKNSSDSLVSTVETFGDRLKTKLNRIPITTTAYGVPYKTQEIVGSREVWAVMFDFGALPNRTTKSIAIPQNILNEWGGIGFHWIDLSNSYVYHNTNGDVLPITQISDVDDGGFFGSTTTDLISVRLTNSDIIIRTGSNRSSYNANVVLKYLKS